MHLAETGGTLQTAVRDCPGEYTNLVAEGGEGWLDGEAELLLQPWVPLSIKVSGASYSSSSEGDVRARSAAVPKPALGEFLTSPAAYDCPGAVRAHTENVFFCSPLLPARAGLDFPLHASSDPINLRTAFP